MAGIYQYVRYFGVSMYHNMGFKNNFKKFWLGVLLVFCLVVCVLSSFGGQV